MAKILYGTWPGTPIGPNELRDDTVEALYMLNQNPINYYKLLDDCEKITFDSYAHKTRFLTMFLVHTLLSHLDHDQKVCTELTTSFMHFYDRVLKQIHFDLKETTSSLEEADFTYDKFEQTQELIDHMKNICVILLKDMPEEVERSNIWYKQVKEMLFTVRAEVSILKMSLRQIYP